MARYLVRSGSEYITTDQVCLGRGTEGVWWVQHQCVPEGGNVCEATPRVPFEQPMWCGQGKGRGRAGEGQGKGRGRAGERSGMCPMLLRPTSWAFWSLSCAKHYGSGHMRCVAERHYLAQDVDGHVRQLPTRSSRPASGGRTIPRLAMHASPLSPLQLKATTIKRPTPPCRRPHLCLHPSARPRQFPSCTAAAYIHAVLPLCRTHPPPLQYGCIPLQLAASIGNRDMVEALLEPFEGQAVHMQRVKRSDYVNYQDNQVQPSQCARQLVPVAITTGGAHGAGAWGLKSKEEELAVGARVGWEARPLNPAWELAAAGMGPCAAGSLAQGRCRCTYGTAMASDMLPDLVQPGWTEGCVHWLRGDCAPGLPSVAPAGVHGLSATQFAGLGVGMPAATSAWASVRVSVVVEVAFGLWSVGKGRTCRVRMEAFFTMCRCPLTPTPPPPLVRATDPLHCAARCAEPRAA